jgi:hypothetical protein
VSAEFQIIVAQDKNDEWVIDCVEPMEIHEIEMMGVKIEYENKRKVLDHFRSLGIDLWDEIITDMKEHINMGAIFPCNVNELPVFSYVGMQFIPVMYQ